MFYDVFFNSSVSYILQVVPITVLSGSIYFIISSMRHIQWGGNQAAKCLFVCYMTALLNIVLVPANFWSNIWYQLYTGMSSGNRLEFFTFHFNLVPTFVKYLTGEYIGGSWIRFMTVANVLLTIPFGILYPLAFPGRRTLKTAAAVILAIELLQPIIGRSFDVDDLICNFLGVLIGYGIFRITQKVLTK